MNKIYLATVIVLATGLSALAQADNNAPTNPQAVSVTAPPSQAGSSEVSTSTTAPDNKVFQSINFGPQGVTEKFWLQGNKPVLKTVNTKYNMAVNAPDAPIETVITVPTYEPQPDNSAYSYSEPASPNSELPDSEPGCCRTGDPNNLSNQYWRAHYGGNDPSFVHEVQDWTVNYGDLPNYIGGTGQMGISAGGQGSGDVYSGGDSYDQGDVYSKGDDYTNNEACNPGDNYDTGDVYDRMQ